MLVEHLGIFFGECLFGPFASVLTGLLVSLPLSCRDSYAFQDQALQALCVANGLVTAGVSLLIHPQYLATRKKVNI